MPQQPSSADLAKQFGGTPAAAPSLAAQFGGVPAPAEQAPPAPPKTDSWFDTAVSVLNAIPGAPHPEDLKKLVQWLPTVGGAAGGLLGAPGGPVTAATGAMLGGAAGEGLKQGLNRLTGEKLSGTESAKRIGLQGAIQGGTELVGGTVVAPLMKHGAGVLMQSAIKPGAKDTAKALLRGVEKTELPIVKTLLKEGLNVTPGGIAKLDRIINATNDEIADAINTLPGRVNPQSVATRTQAVAEDVAKQVDPGADVSAVEGVTRRFLGQEGTTKAGQIGTEMKPTGVLDATGRMVEREMPVMGRVSRDLSLPEAQAMKQGTYKQLRSKAYGELKAPEVEAQKALARGLKEEIESEAKKYGVNLAPMNAREGAAIVTKEAIAKRLAAAGNRDPISLAWLASNPTTGLLFVMERSPAVKSMLARGLYRPAATAARVPENVLRMMVTAIASHDQESQ